MQHVVECLSGLCKGKKNLDLKVESAILIQYTFFPKVSDYLLTVH